jgi:hypothetical protein
LYPQGKPKTRDYDRLQGFTDEVLKTAKAADQEMKPEDPKGDFPEVNYIFGGPYSYEPKRKQKLTTREVMAVCRIMGSLERFQGRLHRDGQRSRSAEWC